VRKSGSEVMNFGTDAMDVRTGVMKCGARVMNFRTPPRDSGTSVMKFGGAVAKIGSHRNELIQRRPPGNWTSRNDSLVGSFHPRLQDVFRDLQMKTNDLRQKTRGGINLPMVIGLQEGAAPPAPWLVTFKNSNFL
jgi:hypothetical protein